MKCFCLSAFCLVVSLTTYGRTGPDLDRVFGVDLRTWSANQTFYMGEPIGVSQDAAAAHLCPNPTTQWNQGNDGSPEKPFCRFSELTSYLEVVTGSGTIPAGTQILVSGELLLNDTHEKTRFAGEFFNPVVVRKNPLAETAVIYGSVEGWYPALRPIGTYAVFRDLIFRDGGSHVLHVDGGEVSGFDTETVGMAFLGCTLENGRNAVVKASQMQALIIRGCHLRNPNAFPNYNPNSNQNFDAVGVRRIEVTHSIVEGGRHSLFVAKGGSALGYIANNVFRNQDTDPEDPNLFLTEEPAVVLGGSTFQNSGDDPGATVYYYPGANFEAWGMTFVGNVVESVSTFLAIRGCHDCVVKRNTFKNSFEMRPQYQLIRWLDGNQDGGGGQPAGRPAVNLRTAVTDNIIEGGMPETFNWINTGIVQCIDWATAEANNIFANNTIHAPPAAEWHCDTLSQHGNGNIYDDPELDGIFPARIDLARDNGSLDWTFRFSDFFTHDIRGAVITPVPSDRGAMELE